MSGPYRGKLDRATANQGARFLRIPDRKKKISLQIQDLLSGLLSSINLIDIDECAEGSHNCSADADCTNTIGSFNCTCKPHYQGNGVICTGEYKSQQK